MTTTSTLPSADVLGLVLVTAKVEADPRSDVYGHGPTHVVETLHHLTEADQHVTLGQLVARHSLDEGDALTVRFATPAEQRAQLAKLIDPLVTARAERKRKAASLTDDQLAEEIACLQGVEADAQDYEDELTERQYAWLHALQDEQARRQTQAAQEGSVQ